MISLLDFRGENTKGYVLIRLDPTLVNWFKQLPRLVIYTLFSKNKYPLKKILFFLYKSALFGLVELMASMRVLSRAPCLRPRRAAFP